MVQAIISSFVKGLLGKVDPLGAAPLLRFDTNTIIVIIIVLLIALGLWYYMRRGQSGTAKAPLKHVEASNDTARAARHLFSGMLISNLGLPHFMHTNLLFE